MALSRLLHFDACDASIHGEPDNYENRADDQRNSSNRLVEQHLEVVTAQEVHADHEQQWEQAHDIPRYSRRGGDDMDLATHTLALAQDMRHPRQNIHQIA